MQPGLFVDDEPVNLFRNRYADTPLPAGLPEASNLKSVSIPQYDVWKPNADFAITGLEMLLANADRIRMEWLPIDANVRNTAWKSNKCAITLQIVAKPVVVGPGKKDEDNVGFDLGDDNVGFELGAGDGLGFDLDVDLAAGAGDFDLVNTSASEELDIDGLVTDSGYAHITGLQIPNVQLKSVCEEGVVYQLLPLYSDYMLRLTLLNDTVTVNECTLDQRDRYALSSTMIVDDTEATLFWPYAVQVQRSTKSQSLYFFMAGKKPFNGDNMRVVIQRRLKRTTPFFLGQDDVFAAYRVYKPDEYEDLPVDGADDDAGLPDVYNLNGVDFQQTPVEDQIQQNTSVIGDVSKVYRNFKVTSTSVDDVAVQSALHGLKGMRAFRQLMEVFELKDALTNLKSVQEYFKRVPSKTTQSVMVKPPLLSTEVRKADVNESYTYPPSEALTVLFENRFPAHTQMYVASFEISLTNCDGFSDEWLLAVQQRVFCELGLLADELDMVLSCNKGVIKPATFRMDVNVISARDAVLPMQTAQTAKRRAMEQQAVRIAAEDVVGTRIVARPRDLTGVVVEPVAIATVAVTDADFQLPSLRANIIALPDVPENWHALFGVTCSIDNVSVANVFSFFEPTFDHAQTAVEVARRLKDRITPQACMWSYAWCYNTVEAQLWDNGGEALPAFMSRAVRPRPYSRRALLPGHPPAVFFSYLALARIPIWDEEANLAGSSRAIMALLLMRNLARTMLEMHVEFASVVPAARGNRRKMTPAMKRIYKEATEVK